MKVFKNILSWAAICCMVLAIALLAVTRLTDVELRAVVSGSMEPEIPVGSLVVIIPADAKDIHVGDDIAFKTESGKVVTHRVVGIDLEADEFTTWGIANDPSATDAPSRYVNILGVVRLHLPYAGYIFSKISTASGKILTVTGILAVYILSVIIGGRTKEKASAKGISRKEPEQEDGKQ